MDKAQAKTPALLLTLALFAWLAINWFLTASAIPRNYNPFPIEDYWRAVVNLPRYQHFDLTVLWEQHNEHRIVAPELVLAADDLLFQGRELLPLTLSILFQLVTLLAFAWAIWKEDRLSPSLRAAAICATGALLGWPGISLVLARPFLVQWFIQQVAAVLSLAALAAIPEHRRRGRLLAAVVALGLVATLSSGNGMILWPVLIAFALALPLTWSERGQLVAGAAVSIGIFFAGYHPLGTTRTAAIIAHPFYPLAYIASYLSMPFGALDGGDGWRIGGAALVLLMVLSAVALSRRWLASRSSVVLLGACLFSAMTAAVSSLGRVDPNGPTPSTLMPARYLNVPLCFWAALALFLVVVTARLTRSERAPWIALSVFSALAIAQLSRLGPWIEAQSAPIAREQFASLAVENGLQYGQLFSEAIYYDPEMVQNFTPLLRRARLSVFARDRFQWIGKPASSLFRFVNQHVEANLLTMDLVESGFQLSGWMQWSGYPNEHSADVLFTNQNGTILGFGNRLRAGIPLSLPRPGNPQQLEWAGFANLSVPSASIRVYAILDGTSLAQFGPEIPLPAAHPASYREAGQYLGGITWTADPAWTLNGFHPSVTGWPPGVIYGSWSGSDAKTGHIESSVFPAPPGNCVVIPVGHGPSIDGQSVTLFDAGTGATLSILPISPADQTSWRYWLINLPLSTHSLQIRGKDDGAGWGQWSAIGTPARCTSSYGSAAEQ